MNINLINTIWNIKPNRLTPHEKFILLRLASASNYEGTTEPFYIEDLVADLGMQRLLLTSILSGLQLKGIIYGDVHQYTDLAKGKSYSLNIVELEKLTHNNQFYIDDLLEIEFYNYPLHLHSAAQC